MLCRATNSDRYITELWFVSGGNRAVFPVSVWGDVFCQNKQCIIHVSQLTSANIPRYGLLPLLTLGRKKFEDKSSHITRKLHNKVMYISHNKNHHRCTFTYLRFTAFLLNYIFFHVMTEVLESNCLQPKFLKCSCFLSATCWLFSRSIT